VPLSFSAKRKRQEYELFQFMNNQPLFNGKKFPDLKKSGLNLKK